MPDVVPGNTATTFNLSLGSAVTGFVDTAPDQDWYRINLTAGQTYTFQLWGSGTEALWDSYLSIYDVAGTFVAENDDGGQFYNAGTWISNRDSQLSFTASYSGTYFISAAAYQSSTFDNIGSYTLTAAAVGAFATLTNLQVADYLTGGYWVASDLRDGVDRDDGPRAFADHTITVNLLGLDADGQRLARAALDSWEHVCNIDFVETTSGGAQIIFTDDSGFNASSGSNVSGSTIISSTVDVGRAWLDYFGTSFNSYSFQTYIHEIGHAIGMGHAGPYNGSASYGVHNIYGNDSWAFSIMSYMDQAQSGYGAYQLLIAPQAADMIAAQNLYGIPYAVAFDDFNGDGRDDLYWHNNGSGNNVMWLMNGTQAVGSAAIGGDAIWRVIGNDDFNGDGRADLIWHNGSDNTNVMWQMNGTQVIGSSVLGGDATWSIVGNGDFNGDGRADLVWHNSSTDSNVMWLMDGSQIIGSSVVGGDATWSIVGNGDFNGDGRADLIWHNSSTDSNVMWLMNGGQIIGSSVLGGDATWSIVGNDDFNGDGRSDLIWHNSSTDSNVMWLMNGGQIIGSSVLGGDAVWSIVGNGDLNGDGRADLIWHNNNSGGNLLWLMNGTQIIGAGALGGDGTWML